MLNELKARGIKDVFLFCVDGCFIKFYHKNVDIAIAAKQEIIPLGGFDYISNSVRLSEPPYSEKNSTE